MTHAEEWNQRYQAGDTPWDTGRPSSELLRVIQTENVPRPKALELGCGTGTNAVWLAQQGFHVTALDFSPLALQRARERARQAGVNVRWIQADVLHPPDLGGPYDFVFDRGCYHCVRRDDVEAYLNTLRKVTGPGSAVLVLAGNAKEPHDPGPPVVSEDELRIELGRLLEIVWLREFYFDQVEPDGVRFLAWSCLGRRRA
jgi:SAM-dependent methyltransferase